MHLQLIAREPLAVQLHLVTVVPAFFLGTWLIFFSRKGARYHRVLGFFYLALMTVTAFAAIFIQSLHPGHFTWIHIFVPITLWGVVAALWRIRKGDVQGHKAAMLGTYFGGLIIAGGFTFIPGRLMYEIFFGRG